MSARVEVLLDHKISDYRDAASVVAKLQHTIPAAQAVQDYWLKEDWSTIDPTTLAELGLTNSSVSQNELDESQYAWETKSYGPRKLHYHDPTGLFHLRFTNRLAVIAAEPRWRLFLKTEALRQMHLNVFRMIARALGATRLVYYQSYMYMEEAHREGKSQEECIAILEKEYGPPQPSVELIAPQIVAAAEHNVPTIWFVEEFDQ